MINSAAAPHPELRDGEVTKDHGLLLIGLFKLSKALLFFLMGLGALHMINRNVGDELIHLVMALRLDTEGRFVQFMLEKADQIDAHRLKQIGFADFAYAALALTEGIGLMKEKVWAEYLTLGLTLSFLPYELFELIRHPSWVWLSLLATNLAVLVYLLWWLDRKKKRRVGVPAAG